MRFASLGSGSRGNATIVEAGATTLLIDCGFSERETRRRLGRLGRSIEDLDGILVTHEHGDHIRGVSRLAGKHSLPVWMTLGTWRAVSPDALPHPVLIDASEHFTIGDIEVHPLPVPHDAREPVQFLFADGRHRLGVLTDVGCSTLHLVEQLSGCDALVLECNHDVDLLEGSVYPAVVRERIRGRFGHLSNEQAAALLKSLDCSYLQHVVAAHLSETNNSPHHVRYALADSLDCDPEWIAVALQESGLGWREIG